MKKDDGKTYVYVRNGRTYVSTLHIKGSSAIAVYMPNGTLLTNASVTVNGIPTTTDGNGNVYMSGDKGKKVSLDIIHNESYKTKVICVFGEDAEAHLKQLYRLTVAATGFTYSDKFTITTTVDGVSHTGSLSMYLAPNTSVTVKANDTSGEYDWSYSTYVKLDGTNTKKWNYTFTMDTNHDVTFTNGTSSYIGSGT
jgi:hypothetical protein